MNELVNFQTGEIDPSSTCKDTSGDNILKMQQTKKGLSEIEKEDLPFNPLGDLDIDDHTISISAIHYNNEDA